MNMTSLTQTIVSLLAAHPERPVLIALDGRCGSGKTTLAAQLAEQFPGSAVFHTDDYYLPPAQRIPNWAETPCANMDLTRLREEVLVPAQAGAAVRSRAYSCREGSYLPEQCVPPHRSIYWRAATATTRFLQAFMTSKCSSPVPRKNRPAVCRRGKANATKTLSVGGSLWKRPTLRSAASKRWLTSSGILQIYEVFENLRRFFPPTCGNYGIVILE